MSSDYLDEDNCNGHQLKKELAKTILMSFLGLTCFMGGPSKGVQQMILNAELTKHG